MLKTNFGSSQLFSTFVIKVIVSLLILALLIILIVLPLEIPFSINVPGKVFAAEEWIIMKGRDGQLITLLKDYRIGISKSYSVTEFERGDNANFSFNSKIRPGNIISKSDTIGSIFSNELEVRLTSLRGQLIVTNELLNSSLSGEKESLIQEAKHNLDYAKKRAEVDGKILDRQEKLFEKGLISEEKYDSAKYTVELDEIAIEIAEAQLQSVLTGEKREQIALIKSQISALEKEIDILEQRSTNYNLTSPVNGYVSGMLMGDTLMIISDTSSYIISMPIPLQNRKYLSPQVIVWVTHPFDNSYIKASLDMTNNSVEYLFMEPVVFANAIVESSGRYLMPGLLVECKLDCGNLKISDHLDRIFKSKIFR